ncbi:hypothetical protein F7D14_02450 [Methylocystis parvus]|uniref:Uncharacterized protein n=1 Tax=Methylocystis parvus TaxID=134 RepID=A0A6B8M2H9_9HYPH|nr:hypothetical protein F7D14_02450 [Methylocystis parvus]
MIRGFDRPYPFRLSSTVIASEAKQSRATSRLWIASSLALLAMTGRSGLNAPHPSSSPRARRHGAARSCERQEAAPAP